jgi:hypothetical protein
MAYVHSLWCHKTAGNANDHGLFPAHTLFRYSTLLTKGMDENEIMGIEEGLERK